MSPEKASPGNNLPLPEENHTARSMNLLVADMRTFAENPSGKDGIEANFYVTALDKLETDPDFHGVVHEFVSSRPELQRNHVRYLLLRSFQKMAIRDHGSYPAGFTADTWSRVIERNLTDPDRRAELKSDLLTRHLNTNIPDRYKSLPPIIAWMRAHGRVGESVSILDIGSSVNHGLKKLAIMDVVHGEYFSNTVMVDPVDVARPWAEQTPNPTLTEKVTDLQNRPVGLSYGIGLDRDQMADPDSQEWARACLTPREFEDKSIESHDKLDVMNPSNVRFAKYNFLDDYASELLRSNHGEHEFFDVVTMFTVLNQLTDRERFRLLTIAQRYVKQTGLVVVQDFARVNPDSPYDMMFLDSDWNKNFSYRTIVIDRLGNNGYQEVWLYDGGRCRVAQAALGRIAAVGSAKPQNFRDFLLSS